MQKSNLLLWIKTENKFWGKERENKSYKIPETELETNLLQNKKKRLIFREPVKNSMVEELGINRFLFTILISCIFFAQLSQTPFSSLLLLLTFITCR